MKIKIKDNVIDFNEKFKGGNILLDLDGFAWLCDSDGQLTRFVDGDIETSPEHEDYILVGKCKEIITE